jgi:cyanophycinase
MKTVKRHKRIPRGILLIIGGAEHKDDHHMPDMQKKENDFEPYDILKQLLPAGRKKQIVFITVGSQLSKQSLAMYRKALRKLGFNGISFLVISNKEEAKEESYLELVENAEVVFFSGGDQFKASTILGGTPIVEIVIRRYYEDAKFIVAGTSAGAMVMSQVMIAEGGVNEGLLKSDLKTYAGFGLLELCIVDTHFIKRGRFGRLAQAVITNPGHLGIGLGEDTALVIKKGDHATCCGSGTVVLIDGTRIEQTNITDAEQDCPVFVENLIVHMLTKGCRFDLRRRQLARPAINSREMKS